MHQCTYTFCSHYHLNLSLPQTANIYLFLANTYVLGIIDGTYVGMCEDTGTI